MIERHWGLTRRHRNARRPVLVVDEAQLARSSLFVGAMRALHQIDAELARDVADDQV